MSSATSSTATTTVQSLLADPKLKYALVGAALLATSSAAVYYGRKYRRRRIIEGSALLLDAVARGDVQSVKSIARSYPGQCVNVSDLEGNTPVLLALKNGREDIARELFSMSPSSWKQHRNKMNWTPLHAATYGELVSVVKDMVADNRSWVDEEDVAGWTPFVIAVSKGNMELFRLFLAMGASYSIKTAQDYTPVMIACNNGYEQIVRELLEIGVDCSIQSHQSMDTALHMAIKNKHKEIVKQLLNPPSNTSTIQSKTNLLSITNKIGSIPLHVAVASGDIEIVKLLLSLGSDANAKRGDGYTPLHLAAIQNNIEIAKLLVGCTDINSESRFGTTPLHEAARRGFVSMVELLINHGAEVNAKDNDDMTSLHAASSGCHVFKNKDGDENSHEHLNVVRLLIDSKANLQELDRGGSNALHIASCCGPDAAEIVQHLLDAGIDFTLENYIGWTPLHFAMNFKGENLVVDIIRKHAEKHNPEFLASFDPKKERYSKKHLPVADTIPMAQINIGELASSIRSGVINKIVVLTGAGISVSAGIPDFRSPKTGLYSSDVIKSMQLASPQDVFSLPVFMQNPQPFYQVTKTVFWPVIKGDIQPTAAHWFIKLLHDKGLLLRNYTQNIDGLERVAGLPTDLLVESHGTFATASCPFCRLPLPEQAMQDKFWKKVEADEIPSCERCGRAIKPDVVFFGESLPPRFFNLKQEDFKHCDLLIVMGTSLQVYPFASLPNDVKKNTPRILINRDAVGPFTRCGPLDVALLGDCDSGVRELVSLLGWTKEFEQLAGSSIPALEPAVVTDPVDV
eukprot:TRINITY_DN696_c0_g1_i1.p1 TRINITY_DN696_c0_g1~~TRINITY_DN696_c0_g1_i1.p1  ORF type:complete len:798 (+),score=192.75 TRINITY_DN696_c0_g1_i1:215-2608(+)